jgi:hypothetical protein
MNLILTGKVKRRRMSKTMILIFTKTTLTVTVTKIKSYYTMTSKNMNFILWPRSRPKNQASCGHK